MPTPQFSLPPELFAQVFPFHLVFNRDTELVQIGKLLHRLYPQLLVGCQLGEHFRIERPSIGMDFNAIRERSQSLFLLASQHNAMRLRGQMMYVEPNDVMVFLGSPWITELTELKQLGLKLNDFAIHDPLADILFLLQAQNTALADAKNLTEKVTEQRAEVRKALEKEIELNELKTRFITTTSHEFRTPLATILSSAELLEYYSHRLPESEKQELLQQIETATKRMTQLLNDVLAINKAEAGKVELKPAPLNLEKLCRQIVAEIQLNAGNKHELVFVNSGGCTSAVMDEKVLQHILSNLLDNAVKYSPSGGIVKLKLACENGEASFEIQDSGIGIPPEDRQKLFESFHRAQNVGNIAGTGLGLSIVKSMVDLHGGSISVQSEVGVGTTFTVTIPTE